MTAQRFTVRLSDTPTDRELERLFARCADLCVLSSPRRAVASILVDRQGPTMVEAIVSAIRDLDVVGLHAEVVEPDAPCVPVDALAERLRRPPEVVRQWMMAGGAAVSPSADAPDQPFATVNLTLRLRGLVPSVEQMVAIRALIP